MSDDHLRACARSQDTLEERIVVLHARVRIGDLTTDRLHLAAYCGDEAARALVSEPHDPEAWRHDAWMGVLKLAAAPDEPWCGFVTCESITRKPAGYAACLRAPNHDGAHYLITSAKGGAYDIIPSDLGTWVRGLERWEHQVRVRAVIAAGRVVHRKCVGSFAATELRDALDKMEAWLACPCEEHRHRLLARRPLFSCIAHHVRSMLDIAVNPNDRGFLEAAVGGFASFAEDDVRGAIQQALVEWALGGAA